MTITSQVKSFLSLEYMTTEHENKYFDRKSARIKVSDLAPHICGFANADGGTLVIGISDKACLLEGINKYGEDKINDFINAPKDLCKPMPQYQEEFIYVTNADGEEDRLLLLHIFPSINQVIRTVNDSTWLRIGDKTKEMLGENLRNLEYTKSSRHYEDELNEDAEIEDLDSELLEQYKKHIGADGLSYEQILKARGFLKNSNGKDRLTNAAVLLFAKNVQQFYPNCRIRFVRYDGTFLKVGTKMNIIRDTSIELPILRMIEKAREFISTQLREFTALNYKSGRFETVPEYPEFAWFEGIVNAVTHREYAMTGSYIKISMYDDRLEIESPGKLPNIVTIENIRETRYSRNPRISRVLTDFGWVRELNEGVKRIYSDMEDFFLEPPAYSEPEHSVLLILRNNIVMRTERQNDRAAESIGIEKWEQLDNLEKQILTVLSSRGKATCADLVSYTGKSRKPVSDRLNNLISLNIIRANGKVHDPKRTYTLL